MEQTEKKQRKAKSLQERLQEHNKAGQRLQILQAKEVLNKMDGFRPIQEALDTHRKYITEGENLLDDVKYGERKARLLSRLDALEKKRAIAQADVSRRETLISKFENVTRAIGAQVLAKVEGGENVDASEIEQIFTSSITEDDKAVLLDTADPYANYRRKKNAVSDENLPVSDNDED